ncbi:PEPxxWA-CTERM sorting domain-containing protein [Parazoarcus communis]|uniref:PEPxxWA-CTERM sorting domain-containing protein n=1 Tax=Parazoarcus communis TaxID=41977 RepID=UPI002006EFC2|nr:PEPxxWA-CTERM sorting domain-containing protein [Parazoarcus communis]
MAPVVLARKLLASSTLALCVCSPALAATQYTVDSFIWQKGFDNGDTWLTGGNVAFFDGFTDGLAPPNAPALSSGTATSYTIRGATDPSAVIEFAGKLWLTPSLGTPSIGPDGSEFRQSRVRLNTNIDENVPALGFNQTATNAFTAIYDLVLPTPGESYGVRLGDGHSDPFFNDILDFTVLNYGGSIALAWARRTWDVPYTFIDGVLPDIPNGADQIVLSLAKEDAASNAIRAYYGFYDSSTSSLIGSMTALNTITTAFNGESFARMELLTMSINAPVPEPETYAMLLAGLGIIGAAARRRQKAT